MTASDLAGIAVLSLAWAGSYLLFRLLVHDVPALSIAASRVLAGAGLLHLILAMRGRVIARPAAGWHSYLLMGFLNNALPFVLIIHAARQLGAGLLAVMLAATPLFTAVLAHLCRITPLDRGRVAGVLLGFFGVAVLVGPAALIGDDVGAYLAVLAAAASYAIAGLYGRCFADLPAIDAAAGQLSGAGILLLPLVVMIDRPWDLPPLPGATWLELATLAVVCTGLPFILFFALLARVGANNVLLVTFLSPVSALLLGRLFLGEAIGGQALAGMALISLGLLAIDGRFARCVAHHVPRKNTC
jgi:drug/metabolite transporter (DMT)-like permease